MANDERPVLSIMETAKLLGLAPNTTYELAKQGHLPILKLGKRILVSRCRLMEMIQNCETIAVSGRSITPDLRWATWERDNFTCSRCGARTMLTIDHIVPVSKGGLTVLSNLRTLCSVCNSKKNNR